MPGQRKRRRQRLDASRRAAAHTAAGTGRWDVVFETQDEREWRARLPELLAGDEPIDPAMARIDTLCGRPARPTTYRLSVFVPDPAVGGPPTDPAR
ncbi:hypothetical protein [Streptomyces sp. NBC_00448]|uniref:hypothetical protein n=1 Tax=Streptomyces sp. NBC_00448 TaxID=2903652 RepID=UPI002E1F782C